LFSHRLTSGPLELDNFPLPPVALTENFFSPLPPIPGPPVQFFGEFHDRRRDASTGRMLKLVPSMAVASFEKSAIEVIVETFPFAA
jgi:hypothetical protein